MVPSVAEPPKKPRSKPGPKPDPTKARTAMVTIRCRPAWRDWLNRFAKEKGKDVADLADEAFMWHARREEFEMPPKR